MPELRKDPITGRWVIISTDRAKRPIGFRPRERADQGNRRSVRFVPGTRGRRRPRFWPTAATAAAEHARLAVRVVPNKFPALGIEGDLDREGEGLFDRMNGVGAHEVIIETPDHRSTLATMPEKPVEECCGRSATACSI